MARDGGDRVIDPNDIDQSGLDDMLDGLAAGRVGDGSATDDELGKQPPRKKKKKKSNTRVDDDSPMDSAGMTGPELGRQVRDEADYQKATGPKENAKKKKKKPAGAVDINSGKPGMSPNPHLPVNGLAGRSNGM